MPATARPGLRGSDASASRYIRLKLTSTICRTGFSSRPHRLHGSITQSSHSGANSAQQLPMVRDCTIAGWFGEKCFLNFDAKIQKNKK